MAPRRRGELSGLTFEGGDGVQRAGNSDTARFLPQTGVQHLQQFSDLHGRYVATATPPKPHQSLQIAKDLPETRV
jgi:hypothetical protein